MALEPFSCPKKFETSFFAIDRVNFMIRILFITAYLLIRNPLVFSTQSSRALMAIILYGFSE